MSVAMVWAETGCTERAKPAASDVITKPRLLKSMLGGKLRRFVVHRSCPSESVVRSWSVVSEQTLVFPPAAYPVRRSASRAPEKASIGSSVSVLLNR